MDGTRHGRARGRRAAAAVGGRARGGARTRATGCSSRWWRDAVRSIDLEAAAIDVDLTRGPAMKIDVFTLFPSGSAGSSSSATCGTPCGSGTTLRLFNYRDTTPLVARPGGRFALRRRGRHGDQGGRRRRRAAGGLRRRHRAMLAERRIAVLTPRRAGRWTTRVADGAGRPRVASRCCVAATRASTSASRDHLANDSLSIGPYVLVGRGAGRDGGRRRRAAQAAGRARRRARARSRSRSRARWRAAPEYPHYTRPASYRGWEVPEVLLSGHHEQVRQWRLEQARRRAQAEREPLVR